MRTVFFLYCLVFVTFSNVGIASEINFLPQWVPHAQFAGYFMASQKGIYDRYGIHVKILEGGPEKHPDKFLAEGQVDAVSLCLAQGIHLRARGIPVVNIAQLAQHSSMLLVARKSSGITRVEDLQGKRISVWGGTFAIPIQAFFLRNNLSVRAFPQHFSLVLFFRGLVDVVSAMTYNEYHTLLMSGINEDELSVFSLRHLGLDFPEDAIFVLQEKFEENPKIWKDFVDATLEGWQYAFAHPEETLDVVMENLRQAHFPANRVHQRWMLDKMRDVIIPPNGNDTMGVLKRKDYERVAYTLKDYYFILSIPEYDLFYRGNKNGAEVR